MDRMVSQEMFNEMFHEEVPGEFSRAMAKHSEEVLKGIDCNVGITVEAVSCLLNKRDAMKRTMSCEEWEYQVRHWKAEAERQLTHPLKAQRHDKENRDFVSDLGLKDKDGSESCSTTFDKDGWETRTLVDSLDCPHEEQSHGTIETARSTWTSMEPAYSGQVNDGMKHGYGCYEAKEGKHQIKYEGEFEADLRHGIGVLEWKDGRTYKGQFQKGKFHGSGDMTWPDGRQYIGQYLNDRKHGLGTFLWGAGRRYEGHWEYGKRHGQGIYVHSDGKVSKGMWEYDRLIEHTSFQTEDVIQQPIENPQAYHLPLERIPMYNSPLERIPTYDSPRTKALTRRSETSEKSCYSAFAV